MDRHLRATALLLIRVLVVALAIMLVTSLATGWLYVLRASVAGWPGLRVADALPLDELPAHDSVPLTVYVAVFGIAGVILAVVARAVRLDRLTAGRLQPVYVAAALAGAAGALIGRSARPGGMTARLLGWLVATDALLSLISALIPSPGPAFGLLERLAPSVVMPTADAALVPVSVLLLLTSRGLARRSQRAWRLAVALLGASVL